MKNLYTIISNYKEGTFIDQIEDVGIEHVLSAWISMLASGSKETLTKEEQNFLKHNFDSEISSPIPLTGIKNVWCCDFSINENYMSVTIVKTDKTELLGRN